MGENHTIDFLQACFTRYRDHQNLAQKMNFYIDFIEKKQHKRKLTIISKFLRERKSADK